MNLWLKFKAKDSNLAWFFLLPGIAVLLITYVYPLFFSLYLSFSSWDMLNVNSSITLRGLDNYIRVIQDPKFLSSLGKTLMLVSVALYMQLVIGMVTALWVTNEGLNSTFTKLTRGLLLAPMIISPIVAGILWRILFNMQYGPINYFLSWFGIEHQLWIADRSSALFSVMIVEIWANTSFVAIILTGALLSISNEPYQAAKVDGANAWRTFFHITLPYLKPVLLIIVLMRIMDLFKTFDFIYSMTYGGPGDSTEVLTMFIYKQGIKFHDITGAAASSWMLLILLLPLSVYMLRKTNHPDNRE